MATYQVSRLSIVVGEADGGIQNIRRRPSGFTLPVFEPQYDFLSSESAPRVEVCESSNSIELGLGTIGPVKLLEIRTTWLGNEQVELTRTFRTPRQALVERIEVFEFQYQICPKRGPLAVGLLRFLGPLHWTLQEDSLEVRTPQYVLNARLEVTGQGHCLVEPVANSDDAALSVQAVGACDVAVSFAVHSAEKRPRDPAVYLLPAPLDNVAYILAALTPALRAVPLAQRPRFPFVRPCPAFLYRAKGMERLPDLPPDYPLGELIRMSDVLVYHWRPGLPDPLAPLISYLRGLPVKRLASTQLILILSENDAGGYFDQLKNEVGEVRLSRVEPEVPEACLIHHTAVRPDLFEVPSEIAAIEEEFDCLKWSSPIRDRSAWRQHFPVDSLPPVPIPQSEDPVLAVPFLTAARLRSGSPLVTIGDATAENAAWPVSLRDTSPAGLPVEAAKFLLADLLTHQALQSEATHREYDTTWRAQLDRLERGKTRADRVIFSAVSGENFGTDRMKLLPAILYSTDIPAPVLPLRISLNQQCRALERFQDYTKAAFEACLAVERRSGKSLGQQFYEMLSQKQQALQTEFCKLLPNEFLEFLRLVKPKEIVNFSVLPLEWLEVEGAPLGYLSKVTTIRSLSPDKDAGFCADLAVAYNSLVTEDLRWTLAEFHTLIIAPEYGGDDQRNVNKYIKACATVLEEWLREEQIKGRDIKIQMVRKEPTEYVKDLLQGIWSLVVYIGHAKDGVLQLPDGHISPSELPSQTFLGTTAILIGCDTQGATNMAGSVASQFLSLGARGVFATYYPLPLSLAKYIFTNLLVRLINLNYQYGDALARTRFSLLNEYLGLRPKSEEADVDYESYCDSWDKFYNEALQELREYFNRVTPEHPEAAARYSSMVLRRTALAGLALTFAGDIRGRLFEF